MHRSPGVSSFDFSTQHSQHDSPLFNFVSSMRASTFLTGLALTLPSVLAAALIEPGSLVARQFDDISREDLRKIAYTVVSV